MSETGADITPEATPAVKGEPRQLDSDGNRLSAYIARPDGWAVATRGQGLVLCHGFPVTRRNDSAYGQGYRELADRLAGETGWTVLSFNFRGTGESEGNFSLGGWLADMQAATSALLTEDGIDEAWLCGFAAGGALAICAAAEDSRVHGVITFSAPADFGDRANDARRFVAQARAVGVIRDRNFPADMDAWARELREIRPLSLIGKVPPRPVMLVHGANDEVVPVLDSRALADAAESQVELRVLAGAGHRLRHDPRAVALLIGWLERQRA